MTLALYEPAASYQMTDNVILCAKCAQQEEVEFLESIPGSDHERCDSCGGR